MKLIKHFKIIMMKARIYKGIYNFFVKENL